MHIMQSVRFCSRAGYIFNGC